MPLIAPQNVVVCTFRMPDATSAHECTYDAVATLHKDLTP